MSLSEDELMDRNQYTTERKRELGRERERELKIIDYINECCDEPIKLINDMDDWEVRKMAYKWVLVLRSKPCPEKKIEKIEDIIAMTAKEIAESKFGY